MILKNIMEKAKTVWSSASQALLESALISHYVTEWCGLL
jgi:hypothetical protein